MFNNDYERASLTSIGPVDFEQTQKQFERLLNCADQSKAMKEHVS